MRMLVTAFHPDIIRLQHEADEPQRGGEEGEQEGEEFSNHVNLRFR